LPLVGRLQQIGLRLVQVALVSYAQLFSLKVE
jgi:hypothetical protein